MAVDVSELVDRVSDAKKRMKAPVILELDLTEGVVEAPPADPVTAALTQRRPRLQDVLAGLRRAADDPRVAAVVVKVGGSKLALTQAQELHDAIAHVRRAGRRTVAWAETFGEFGAGNVPYLVAVACERIYLQPSGDLGLTGIGVEESFVRDALGKAGLTPQLGRRHEYKSAANMFLERGYTPAHREMSERLVASLSEQVVGAVAAGRGLPAPRVRELVDHAPLLAAEALDAGLVDGLAYRDEVYAHVRKDVGERGRLQYVSRYHRAHAKSIGRRISVGLTPPCIALIHAAGIIRLGRSARNPFGAAVGSDTIGAALRSAIRDDRVKAIVVRVDSPGGSYVASDAVRRHLLLARRHGTPIVVSMGRVAASGGYFISMAADTIVAQPGTLTGSIGVVGGKMVTADLAAKVGLTHGHVSGASNALMFSPRRTFSDEQWARMNAMLDRIYDDFTAKVAEDRSLDRRVVDRLARGRVWTGADAREHGLVDELGGLERAIELAKAKARLSPDVEVDLRIFPRTTMLDRLRPPASSEDAAANVSSVDGVRVAAWGRFASAAAALGLPAAGPLTLPGTWDVR